MNVQLKEQNAHNPVYTMLILCNTILYLWNLKKLSAFATHLYKNLQFMAMKFCRRQKPCSPSPHYHFGNLSFNLLFLSKPTHMQKNSILTQFSHGLLQILYWELLLKVPGVTDHTHKWIESNRCICVCLKSNFILKFILIRFKSRFILTKCFDSIWAPLTAPTWIGWKSLLLLLIPYHMQKTNFIT